MLVGKFKPVYIFFFYLNLKKSWCLKKAVWMLKESDPAWLSHTVSLHCAPRISDTGTICFHVYITVSVVSEVIEIVHCLLLDCLNTYAVKTKGFNGTFLMHVMTGKGRFIQLYFSEQMFDLFILVVKWHICIIYVVLHIFNYYDDMFKFEMLAHGDTSPQN